MFIFKFTAIFNFKFTLTKHLEFLAVTSFMVIYLCLDDANLTARWNHTRNNIRVNRNWVGHVTWTDQWGLNDSETHRRAGQRRLGQCKRVGSHARYGGKLLFFLSWFFICLCSCQWWRLGLCWDVLYRGALFGQWWLYEFVNESLSINLKRKRT